MTSQHKVEIRRLMAEGNLKSALDLAKEIHKAAPDRDSEELLVDVYAARVRQLAKSGLQNEADALGEVVRTRYPASAARMDDVANLGWLRPLADPDLPPDVRTALEQRVAREVIDLDALAGTTALPQDHPLRKAAASLRDAFEAVTSGPVEEERLVLNGVSRRSPLAAWKSLIAGIAALYRRDAAACERYLRAIPLDAAVAKLSPAILHMIQRDDGRPAPPAAHLASRISPGRAVLRKVLIDLENALMAHKESKSLGLIEKALSECERVAPSLGRRLRQHISVRCAMCRMVPEKVRKAMGGPAPREAYFHRLLAQGMEVVSSGVDAAAAWENFRQSAISEKLFAEGSRESAMLDMQIAKALTLPRYSPPAFGNPADFDPYFYYQRACDLDPCAENFQPWLDWIGTVTKGEAESVAASWSRACPGELRPVLYQMEVFEKRSALQKAAKQLARAEEIDSVHPAVRGARLRLLIKILVRHIEQGKPHLATKDLAEIEALPQARQGDIPGMLAAMRFFSAVGPQAQEALIAKDEVLKLLGTVAGPLMLQLVGYGCGLRPPLIDVGGFSATDKAELPTALVRVHVASQAVSFPVALQQDVFSAAHRAFVEHMPKMEVAQLRSLNEIAIMARNREFGYAVSAVGLAMGGPSEARFLLFRGQSVPLWQSSRATKCLAAALALARETHDTDTINQVLRNLPSENLEIDAETLALVRKTERETAKFPAPGSAGPNYSRNDRSRGKAGKRSPFDFMFNQGQDDDDDDEPPQTGPGTPPDLKRMLEDLMNEVERAVERGLPFPPPRPRKKRRRSLW